MSFTPKLIDCCVFAEEIEILQIRLSEMYPVCDQILIVESNRTQTRLEKPFNFELNKDKFTPWLDKITYYKLEDFIPEQNNFCWQHEKYQRNCLMNALAQYQKEKDIILTSELKICLGDVDEVVNGQLLKQTAEKDVELVSFDHIFGSYFLNFYAERSWFGAVLTTWENIQKNGFQHYREIKDKIPHIHDTKLPSWHFSSVGNPVFDFNWHKWETRIEPADKLWMKLPDAKKKWKKLFDACVLDEKYFFFCDDPSRRDISVKLNILPNKELPGFVQKNLAKFAHLMYPTDVKL